jgi:hypothetical protein
MVLGLLVELSQQDGLSHTAQTMQDHGPGGSGIFYPVKGHAPVLQLAVAADQYCRAQTRTGGVGVVSFVHG